MTIRLIGINDAGLWVVTSLSADEGTLEISYGVDNEINLEVIGSALLAITNGMLAGSIPASKLVMSDLVLTEAQITNLTSDLNSLQAQINTKISGNQTITVSGDVSGSGATSITLTLSDAGVAGTYNTVTTDPKGRVVSGTSSSSSLAVRTIQTIAAAANGFQVSATRKSMVNYSVLITATTSLNSDQRGDVVLEIAPTNSSSAGDWVTIAKITNGQSSSLPILSTVVVTHTMGGQLFGFIPAGYYCRLRSINTTGSPTYSYVCGEEVLL